MFALVEAIKTAWAGNATLAAIPGGLSFRHPAGTPSMPYATFEVAGGEPSIDTSTTEYQDVRATISIYSRKGVDVQPYAVAAKQVFHVAALTLDAPTTLIGAKLENESIIDLDHDDATLPQCYYEATYRFTLTQAH